MSRHGEDFFGRADPQSPRDTQSQASLRRVWSSSPSGEVWLAGASTSQPPGSTVPSNTGCTKKVSMVSRFYCLVPEVCDTAIYVELSKGQSVQAQGIILRLQDARGSIDHGRPSQTIQDGPILLCARASAEGAEHGPAAQGPPGTRYRGIHDNTRQPPPNKLPLHRERQFGGDDSPPAGSSR